MEKLKPILSLVLRILFALVLVTSTILSVATAYIVFAPDDFPKPFYLVYAYPESGVPPTYSISKPESESDSSSSKESSSSSDESSSDENTTPSYEEGEYVAGEGIMYDTGTKIINLADEGGNKYISIAVTLEFAPDDATAYEEYLAASSETSSGEGEGEATTVDYLTAFDERLSAKSPIFDDIITMVVSSHQYADIYTLEGKEALKEEIITKINESLPEFFVIAVYFTNFVVEG